MILSVRPGNVEKGLQHDAAGDSQAKAKQRNDLQRCRHRKVKGGRSNRAKAPHISLAKKKMQTPAKSD